MRGGNRQVALIAIEAIATCVLLGIWLRIAMGGHAAALGTGDAVWRRLLLALLLSSPIWLAFVYLTPLPVGLWSGLAGRGLYSQLMTAAGFPAVSERPLSLTPDATAASLLAGIPLVAAFLIAYAARLRHLKFLLQALVLMAFLQVLLGLLQIAGGGRSSLNFDSEFGGAIGTFANTNHFANYISMALPAYVWLAWASLTRIRSAERERISGLFTERNAQAFWILGGLILVIGILMSRSRGAALTGIPVAMVAVAVAFLAGGWRDNWRATLLLIALVLAAAIALLGLGTLLSKFDPSRLATDASFRSLLASSTLTGAREFWPWGAGWGSYGAVYPRFQPVEINGYAEYAHQDYAQMLFEGGVFGVILAGAFACLAVTRGWHLVRTAVRHGELNTAEMASALCGLGLLALLAHSLVEFNMHIPANAIVGALLAGAFLRPLAVHGAHA
jgi:O-antigen ligase